MYYIFLVVLASTHPIFSIFSYNRDSWSYFSFY